jgi:hypothetical protein
MSFFNSSEMAYLGQTEPIFILKHISYRMDSFHKLTQFSQGNNVLEYPDTCLSIQRYMCFLNSAEKAYLMQHETFSTLKHLNSGSIPFKNCLVLKGEQCARCSCFWHRWFSSSDSCVLQLSNISFFGAKWDFLNLENHDLQEAFLSKTILTGKQCRRWSCF